MYLPPVHEVVIWCQFSKIWLLLRKFPCLTDKVRNIFSVTSRLEDHFLAHPVDKNHLVVSCYHFACDLIKTYQIWPSGRLSNFLHNQREAHSMTLEPGLALYIVFTLQNSFTGIGQGDKISFFAWGSQRIAGIQCHFHITQIIKHRRLLLA